MMTKRLFRKDPEELISHRTYRFVGYCGKCISSNGEGLGQESRDAAMMFYPSRMGSEQYKSMLLVVYLPSDLLLNDC